ncbi:MAG: PAS domain S-box protein [Deltaproteobacteria bacterium]|nr:PAS domain S-box protein [Deltaproteobacteria bacterium]
MGVASTDTEAVGYLYAKEKGIYTTRNYHDLYSLKDLNMIIELTGREEVANDISVTKPSQVRLMDHAAARLFWDVFQIEEKRSAEREHAEEVLTKSEQEKQDILESISEAVVYLDREHRIMWANRVARKPHGLALEDVEGRRCYEVWHQLSKPCPGCPIVQTCETGQPQEAEMTSPDGRAWFVRGYPVLDENGDIAGAVELTLEITHRKRAERKLRESEERHRTVLLACPDPVVVYDMEGKSTYINPAFTQVFGWPPEELLGKKLDYVPEENWPETEVMIDKVKAGESFSDVESRRYTKEGEIIDVSISAGIFLDSDGIPLGSVHILRDITDRKRIEAALRDSEQRHRIVMEACPDPVVVYDMEGRCTYTNPAFTTVFGWTPGERLGRKLDYVPEENWPETEVMIEKVKVGESFSDVESRRHTKDGEIIDVSVSAGIYLNRDEIPVGSVHILRNITQRKLAEERLEETMAELQRSNTELQQFAYVASHDLQEPLRKVQAFGNRLKSKYAEALDERGLDYVDRMQNAAKRMQSLINNLLTLSRITTKAQPFVQVNLADVVRGVVADLELHVERAGGHVEAGDMPTIDADPTQMRQLLQNLINNALKFHEPEKNPVVKIHSQLMNETCKITVEDNGIGFDEKYLDRIFAVFQRLHGRGKYDGTGVGLTICQKIAERHGGSITANSTPGRGATFIVTLPVKHKRRGEASNG